MTSLMVGHYPALQTAGNPARQWVDTLSTAAGENAMIALLSAPGYMEDYQIAAYLAGELRNRGHKTVFGVPRNLSWTNGFAHLSLTGENIGLIVRFYQGEWLAQLPNRDGWRELLAKSKTPVVNPGSAVLTESKRFPLTWNSLKTALPTWHRLHPR